MIGAALFNAHTYEEIEADQGALGPAIGVVLLVTVCGAIGGLIDGLLGGEAARGIILGLVAGLMFGIVRWALWVTILLMVGGGLLRTSGTQTSWAESWDLPIPLGYCLFSPLCLLLAGCFRRPRFSGLWRR